MPWATSAALAMNPNAITKSANSYSRWSLLAWSFQSGSSESAVAISAALNLTGLGVDIDAPRSESNHSPVARSSACAVPDEAQFDLHLVLHLDDARHGDGLDGEGRLPDRHGSPDVEVASQVHVDRHVDLSGHTMQRQGAVHRDVESAARGPLRADDLRDEPDLGEASRVQTVWAQHRFLNLRDVLRRLATVRHPKGARVERHVHGRSLDMRGIHDESGAFHGCQDLVLVARKSQEPRLPDVN